MAIVIYIDIKLPKYMQCIKTFNFITAHVLKICTSIVIKLKKLIFCGIVRFFKETIDISLQIQRI